jgi:hypothetical protein
VFDLYDYPAPKETCHQEPFVDEVVSGVLDALPGNNPYTPGPDRITMQTDENPPSINPEVLVFGANHTIRANTDGSSDLGTIYGGSASGGGDSSATKSGSAGESATKGTATETTKAESTSSSGQGSSGGSSGGSSSSGATTSEDNSSTSGSSDLPLGLSALQWGLIGGGVVFLIMVGIM